MSINIGDLRIGNWVYDSEKKVNVQIDGLQFSGRIVVEDKEYDDHKRAIDPYSIPLTHEILEKVGFVTADYELDVIVWDYKDTFLISQNGIPVEDQPIVFEWDNGDRDVTTELKYLHQLQNLYFALTGEELKIEL